MEIDLNGKRARLVDYSVEEENSVGWILEDRDGFENSGWLLADSGVSVRLQNIPVSVFNGNLVLEIVPRNKNIDRQCSGHFAPEGEQERIIREEEGLEFKDSIKIP